MNKYELKGLHPVLMQAENLYVWSDVKGHHLLPASNLLQYPTHLQHYINRSHKLDIQEINRFSSLKKLDQKPWLPTPAGPSEMRPWVAGSMLQNSHLQS